MSYEQKPGGLKELGAYLGKAFKFYDMKRGNFTPVIFMVTLFVSFSSAFTTTESLFTLEDLLGIIILNLASVAYIIGYIKELKGEEYTLSSCIGLVLRKIHIVIISLFLYGLFVALGLVVLIIPGIIIAITFLFNVCYIVDRGEGIIGAFKASKRITTRNKMSIFSIVLIFNLIVFMPMFFASLVALSTNNTLIFAFVTSFMTAIINLMQQRLIALLYIDLEYGQQSRINIKV